MNIDNLTDIKNRVIGLEYHYPNELQDHPGQWREHTEQQAKAMAGVLEEIGIAGALLAWRSERENGKLTTFDGHLRKSLNPRIKWPVLITDLTDEEADYALATHDPISAMANADKVALDALLSSVHTEKEPVQKMLSHLASMSGVFQADFDTDIDDLSEIDDLPYSDTITVVVSNHDCYTQVVEEFIELFNQNPEWEAKIG